MNAVDVAITGGGDSAFLFGAPSGDHTPRLVQRCSAVNVAAGGAVTYGKHGIYGDATLDVSDFTATSSEEAASDLIPVGRHQQGSPAPGSAPAASFPLPISFYDSGEGFGTCDIDQVTLWSGLDTAIWASTNPATGGKVVQQHFIIGPQVEAHVAGSLLFNAELWDAASTLTVSKRATVNGRPATAASVRGVPTSAVTWVA